MIKDVVIVSIILSSLLLAFSLFYSNFNAQFGVTPNANETASFNTLTSSVDNTYNQSNAILLTSQADLSGTVVNENQNFILDLWSIFGRVGSAIFSIFFSIFTIPALLIAAFANALGFAPLAALMSDKMVAFAISSLIFEIISIIGRYPL